MQKSAQTEIEESYSQGDWTVLRKLETHCGTITMIAVSDGKGWKATAEGSMLFRGLEFFGPIPKMALDQAENFVRRLTKAPSAD